MKKIFVALGFAVIASSAQASHLSGCEAETGICFNQFSFVVDIANGIKPLGGCQRNKFRW